MMKCLVNLFLLGFFYSAPVYAVTIVDVSEDSKVVDLEYISDCEWIERIEIHTTTTYQDFVGGDFTPPRYNAGIIPQPRDYEGFHNPCFPEFKDENTVIPDYCTAKLIIQEAWSSSFGSGPLFREWSELSISYSSVYHNECKGCHPTPAPEPANWILGLTGVAIVLLTLRGDGHTIRKIPFSNSAVQQV